MNIRIAIIVSIMSLMLAGQVLAQSNQVHSRSGPSIGGRNEQERSTCKRTLYVNIAFGVICFIEFIAFIGMIFYIYRLHRDLAILKNAAEAYIRDSPDRLMLLEKIRTSEASTLTERSRSPRDHQRYYGTTGTVKDDRQRKKHYQKDYSPRDQQQHRQRRSPDRTTPVSSPQSSKRRGDSPKNNNSASKSTSDIPSVKVSPKSDSNNSSNYRKKEDTPREHHKDKKADKRTPEVPKKPDTGTVEPHKSGHNKEESKQKGSGVAVVSTIEEKKDEKKEVAKKSPPKSSNVVGNKSSAPFGVGSTISSRSNSITGTTVTSLYSQSTTTATDDSFK